jgi:ketosteroid isomerase-like protein
VSDADPQPITDTDPLHRLVRRWAQAVNARDVAALAAQSDPEIDVYPLQIATVSGHYTGHEGLKRWLDDAIASDIGYIVEFLGIRTIGDGRVALFGQVQVEGKAISPYSMIATVRDGKITSMRSYLSDEETMEHLKLLR